MRQIWLTLLMWPLIVLPISAQRAPVSNLTTGFPIAPVEHGAQQIALGNSALALMGPWKFRLGDDLAWARCYWFCPLAISCQRASAASGFGGCQRRSYNFGASVRACHFDLSFCPAVAGASAH